MSWAATSQSKEKSIKKTRLISEFWLGTEKAMEHIGNSDTNHSLNLWNIPEEPGKETEGTGNQWKNSDDPDHSTAEIS